MKTIAGKILSLFSFLFAAFCLVFSVIPVVTYKIVNPGVLALAALGLFFALLPFLLKKWKWLSIPAGLLLLIFLFLNLWMVKTAFYTPPGDEPSTVLILGCQVKGAEPSLMLKRRLDVAAAYLKENPDAPVIVSGGQGEGEDVSEAEAMANYLIAQGIEESRIFKEAQSHNTEQNIDNSLAVLSENQLPNNIIVVTDGFHQLRSRLLLERAAAGLPSIAHLSSIGPYSLLPSYWMRDLGGVVLTLLLT